MSKDRSIYYKILNACKPIKEMKTPLKYKNIKKYLYLEKGKDFPMELVHTGNKFFQLYNQFIVIPSLLISEIDFFLFRSIEEKRFNPFGESDVFYLYGVDSSFEQFRYGQKLIITEGAMDCDTIKMFYPYCVALLTANISINQLEILTSLTNNFALLLDNDDAGRKGTLKNLQLLKKLGGHVEVLKQFTGMKDIADLYDKQDFERNIIIDYYNQLLNN